VTENFCLGGGVDPPVPMQHHSLLIIVLLQPSASVCGIDTIIL